MPFTELLFDVTDGVAIVGFVDWQDDCYNAAAVLAGEIGAGVI